MRLVETSFLKLFDKSKFAIASDDTRYYLNGVFLSSGEEGENEVLRAVATDGHRLAKVEVPLPEGAKGAPSISLSQKRLFLK